MIKVQLHVGWLIFFICLFSSEKIMAGEKIALLYNERAPYQMTLKKGVVVGLTATPVSRALKKENIDHEWLIIPTNRQILMIKENKNPVCGIGWFKNSERLAFAQFSETIYQDKPTVAIANMKVKLESHTSFPDFFQKNKVTLLVKEKYSYGLYTDELLAKLKLKVKTETTTAENIGMINMIRGGRADLMLTSEEEANYFFENAGFHAENFKIIKFKDLPHGETRHLMCSKNVAKELIQKLNVKLLEIAKEK